MALDRCAQPVSCRVHFVLEEPHSSPQDQGAGACRQERHLRFDTMSADPQLGEFSATTLSLLVMG
jgi:hypothetical protein